MDEKEITVSVRLSEFLRLVKSAEAVPDMQKQISKLSEQFSALYARYTEVLLKLSDRTQ